MSKDRLEAFSDGVIAIIITIMVLELKVPEDVSSEALWALAPRFASYVLSFVFVGIYWNNHHHLLQAAECINGNILWANLHLLFWLSLVPFVTGWMGEHGFPPRPVALYGIVLLGSGVAFYLLSQLLVHQHGRESALGKAIGKDRKGLFSLVSYVAGIALSAQFPKLALALYAVVAMVWLIPDRRIEREMHIAKCD